MASDWSERTVPHHLWTVPCICGKRWGPVHTSEWTKGLTECPKPEAGNILNSVIRTEWEVEEKRGPIHACDLEPGHDGPHRCFMRKPPRAPRNAEGEMEKMEPCWEILERNREDGT